MAKKSKKKAKSQQPLPDAGGPWIDRRSGITLILVVSLGLAVFVIWQLFPVLGAESILWGLGFGGAIWLVAGASYLFNTRVRGK